MTDPRVGQPPLDPAHPGWTLPIPPDAPSCRHAYDGLVDDFNDLRGKLKPTWLERMTRNLETLWRAIQCPVCDERGCNFVAAAEVFQRYVGHSDDECVHEMLRAGALPPDRPTPAPDGIIERLAVALGLSPEQRQQLIANHAEWSAALAPFGAELERSQHITAEDLATHVGGQPVSATPEPSNEALYDYSNPLYHLGRQEVAAVVVEAVRDARFTGKKVIVEAGPEGLDFFAIPERPKGGYRECARCGAEDCRGTKLVFACESCLRAGGQPVSATPEPSAELLTLLETEITKVDAIGREDLTPGIAYACELIRRYTALPERGLSGEVFPPTSCRHTVHDSPLWDAMLMRCVAPECRGALPPDRPTPATCRACDVVWGSVPPSVGHTCDQVTMPAAVAERLYWAIINLPVNLGPELCDATEDFYRYVRLRAGGQPVSATPEPTPEAISEAVAKIDEGMGEGAYHVTPRATIRDALRAAYAEQFGVSATPPEPDAAWAISRIEESRAIHLAWVEHLRAHQMSGIACDRCPPDIGHSVGDVDHHLSVVADYERVLRVLRAGASPQPEDSRTLLSRLVAALDAEHDDDDQPLPRSMRVRQAMNAARVESVR